MFLLHAHLDSPWPFFGKDTPIPSGFVTDLSGDLRVYGAGLTLKLSLLDGVDSRFCGICVVPTGMHMFV